MAKEEKKKQPKVKSPKKGNKKDTIIILIVALLISVGTVVLSKIVLWPKYQELKKNNKKKEKVENIQPSKPEIGEIYELKSFTVNTYQSGGRRFAKIKLSLETFDEEVVPELEKRNVQVRSLMLKYFRSKTVADLTNPTFPDSSAADLIEEVNKLLSSGKVSNLYYQDLIVQ